MKILYISHSNFLGGAELCFMETTKALRMNKHEIYAVFPAVNGPLKELCEPLIVDSFTRFLPSWIIDGEEKYSFSKKIKQTNSIVSSIKKARKLIKELNPDVVITNTSIIPEFAIASKMLGVKHVWFIHELVEEGLNSRFIWTKYLSQKIISFCSDKVIINSKFVNSCYQSVVNEKKLKMLYQPADLKLKEEQKIKEENNNVLTLLIIGKIAPFKGQYEAILACKELNERGAEIKLYIVGSGEGGYFEKLKTIVSENNLQDKIEFVPFTSTPETYYQKADIVLVCSRCEALGRITIEAMKMGLPVVASDRGGNLELIKDGVNGYLYQYENPKDLADKILLLQDADARKQMGEAGKKWADEQFNMESFSNELNNVICRL